MVTEELTIDYVALAKEIIARSGSRAPGRLARQVKSFGWKNEVVGEAIAAQKDLETGEKHDTGGSPATSGFMHGPGGLLRYPGVDPAVFQTIIGSMGILSELQWSGSVYANPTFETITGVTGDAVDQGGSEPSDPCDDAPGSGQKKGAIITAPFGLYKRGTREVDITRLGQRVDRADPTDLFVVGSPINNPAFPGAGNLEGLYLNNDQLINEWSNIVADRAIAMHRLLSRQVWTGDPANNAVGGGYKEFPGLLKLVNTGYKDLLTGTAAPAMNSDVWDAAYHRIDDPTLLANGKTAGANLVDMVSYMFRTRRVIAMRTGMEPVRWNFCMQEPLFWSLTKVWPTSYLLGALTVIDAGGQRLTLDAKDQIDLRDQMRSGRFLIIDGMKVDVIFDDGIPVVDHDNSSGNVAKGCFYSSIFLLPWSVMGGRLTTYGEYMQYQNPSIQSVLALPVLARVVGPFIETPRQTNTCIVFDIKVEPRVIFRAPWLAGRIDHVTFCPDEYSRTPFPTDDYFINGGVVGTRPGPDYSSNNVWS